MNKESFSQQRKPIEFLQVNGDEEEVDRLLAAVRPVNRCHRIFYPSDILTGNIFSEVYFMH